jgi:hypothetical protein
MPASRLRKTGTGRRNAAASLHPVIDAQRVPAGFLVVGIGASAGGLDACRQLLRALPANSGMAFIFVQHLDPAHASMMVELLASHTAMTVQEAVTGMRVQPDHLYVIPPGTYLALEDGALQLSPPPVRHGARLPFDFLLPSMATTYGPRAVCITLSGTGADGSIGLKAIKQNDGLVLVQDPKEASYDGMPRNAVLTGMVDSVLTIDQMPDALVRYATALPAGAGNRHMLNFLPGANDDAPSTSRPSRSQSLLRQAALAELCRHTVMESFAPAAVLINLKHECLYHLGPTDRYLQVAGGHPSHDLLAMAAPSLRTKL